MESDRVLIGALIFIVMVLGANFVMYGIARGATKSSGKSFIEMLGKSLNTSTRPKDNSMDELHRKVEELEKGKKDTGGDSE